MRGAFGPSTLEELGGFLGQAEDLVSDRILMTANNKVVNRLDLFLLKSPIGIKLLQRLRLDLWLAAGFLMISALRLVWRWTGGL